MTESLTSTSHRLADDIDAVTDLNEHLRLISELVQRHIPAERRGVFQAKIDDVARRAADPNLNLAVIGEFCSGKSTFINALLRQRLLKAACVVTTASVTRIRKGSTLAITASFTDGQTVTVSGDDYHALRRAIFTLQPAAASDETLKDLLDRLTSDPAVADHVREIDITIPSEQLDENIVILDTPGINAGAATAVHHAEVTQRVMSELADCALVLISAANPMTNSLIEFLESHARSFLHRCVFVITAVDRQDESERAETRGFVREKLREKLGLESPFIVESAAITMLPIAEVPESMKESWAHWQSEFVVLEEAVRAALRRERTLIIAERLIRLLQDLVAEMERELAASAVALDEEERLLRENSVAAIEQVLDALHARSAAEVEKRARALHLETLTHRNGMAAATKEWMHGVIAKNGANIKTYTQHVHPTVVQGVQYYGAQYSKTIDGEIDDLRVRCESLSAEFAQRFEKAYRELPSLGVPISVSPVAIPPAPHPSVFRSALAHAEQQRKTDVKYDTAGSAVGGGLSAIAFGWLGSLPGAIIGAIIGALIGLALGENNGCAMIVYGIIWFIVGAIVGAIFGGVAGTAIAAITGAKVGGSVAVAAAGPNVADRQQQLRVRLASDIDEYFDEMHGALDAHINAAVRGVTASFAAAVNLHKSTYSAAVERLRREHDQKQRDVAQKIITVRADAADLNQRAARLESLRARLARSRVPA